jgi:sulfonate transport system substrate-binding protein
MTALSRTSFLAALTALAVLRSSPAAFAADSPKELRIGYQKSIGTLLILKQKGTLEKRLASQGTTVTWVEFPSGPPLMEALHAGAIDFGYTGDMPPIYAQAAGVDFVYVASIPQPGKSSGILVRADSNIKTLADLRGKKIAVVKGSSGHNVLVRVLEEGNVAWSDITPIYLQPADAGAALRAGNVDAWSIWDPFFALGERYPGVKVLTDAQRIAPSNAFFLATRDYATRYPGTVENVIDEATKAWKWAEAHQTELAQVLADATGVDLNVEQVVTARGNYDVLHMTPHVIKQQQAIADTFTKLGLLPHQVNIAANVWTPSSTAANLSGEQRQP